MSIDKPSSRQGEQGFALLLALLLMLGASALALALTQAGAALSRDAHTGGDAIIDAAVARAAFTIAERRLLPVELGRIPLSDVASMSLQFKDRTVVVSISQESHRANANHADPTILAAAAVAATIPSSAASIASWQTGPQPDNAFWSFSDLALATGLESSKLAPLIDRITLDDRGANTVADMEPEPSGLIAGSGGGRTYRLNIRLSGSSTRAGACYFVVVRSSGNPSRPWILHRFENIL